MLNLQSLEFIFHSILDKLLFYSAISSYRIKWGLGKTKKTHTVLGRGELLQYFRDNTWDGWE